MATGPNYISRYLGRGSLFGSYGMGGLMGNIMPMLMRKAYEATQDNLNQFEMERRSMGAGKSGHTVNASQRGSILERARRTPALRGGGSGGGGGQPGMPPRHDTGGERPAPPTGSNMDIGVNQPGYWDNATQSDALGKSLQMGTGGATMNVDAGTVSSPLLGTQALGAENKVGAGQSPYTPTPGAPIASPGEPGKPAKSNLTGAAGAINQPTGEGEEDDQTAWDLLQQRLLGFYGAGGGMGGNAVG